MDRMSFLIGMCVCVCVHACMYICIMHERSIMLHKLHTYTHEVHCSLHVILGIHNPPYVLFFLFKVATDPVQCCM